MLLFRSLLGLAHDLLGDYRRAIEFHDKSRVIAGMVGDREAEASALFYAARALHGLKNPVATVSSAEAALELYEEVGSIEAENVRAALRKWRENLTSPHLA